MTKLFDSGYYLVHLKVADNLKPGPGVLYFTYNGDTNQATLNNPDLYVPVRQRIKCEVIKQSPGVYACIMYFELWEKDNFVKEKYYLSVDKADNTGVIFLKSDTPPLETCQWTLVGSDEPTPHRTYSFAIKSCVKGVDGKNLNLNFKHYGLEVAADELKWELIPAKGGAPPQLQ